MKDKIELILENILIYAVFSLFWVIDKVTFGKISEAFDNEVNEYCQN